MRKYSFLHLLNKLWLVTNCKEQFCSNKYLGNAAILNDKKPVILQAMTLWNDNWEKLKMVRSL